MTLAVRFRYFDAKTPTFDIVELTDDQWRESRGQNEPVADNKTREGRALNRRANIKFL